MYQITSDTEGFSTRVDTIEHAKRLCPHTGVTTLADGTVHLTNGEGYTYFIVKEITDSAKPSEAERSRMREAAYTSASQYKSEYGGADDI